MKHLNIINLFRCTERQYAESFCQKGNMKFNTPRAWIEMEKKEGKGRGDLLEGVFANLHKNDISRLVQLKNMRQNICGETIENITYLRSGDILDLPSYCLFGLDNNAFSNIDIDEDGIKHYTTKITQQYFKDFSNNATRESSKELPNEEQPVLVIITNPNEFFKRLINYFIKLGFKEEEIIIDSVEYMDKNQGFCCHKEFYPMEVFLKDKSFEYQKEIRVLINTKNKKMLKQLSNKNNIVNIGDLSDISHIAKYYYEIDMLIEKRGNSLLYVLEEPEKYRLDSLSKEKLLGLVCQITNESINKLKRYGIETNQQKVDVVRDIEKILRSKYNMVILWEENAVLQL